MKVTYIEHSSFLIEMDNIYLLFDYYKGDIPKLDREKPLFVFISHRHADHFVPEVFDIEKIHPQIEYIISDDIWQNKVPEELYGKIQFMGYDEKLSIVMQDQKELKIETFKSTDEGVAFWIEYDGVTIYHAGDLNNWQWEGETKAWNNNMNANFHKELEKMAGRKADIAFIPLDPRQKDQYYIGFDELMRQVDIKHAFPMHFWKMYSIITQFKKLDCTKEYRDRVYSIEKEGQEFLL